MDEIKALDRMQRSARRPLLSERMLIVALATRHLLSDEGCAQLRAERRDLYARQREVKARGEASSRLAAMAPAYEIVAREVAS